MPDLPTFCLYPQSLVTYIFAGAPFNMKQRTCDAGYD
jgi:hypothetical protein